MSRSRRVWTSYENRSLSTLCTEQPRGYKDLSRRLKTEFGVNRTALMISNKLFAEANIDPLSAQGMAYFAIQSIQKAERILWCDEVLPRRVILDHYKPAAQSTIPLLPTDIFLAELVGIENSE